MNGLLKTFIVTAALAFSADGTQKTTYLSDQSKLTYNVNESKVLDGAYELYTPDGKMTLRGAYKDNQRAGNWYAFNPDGSIFLRYNYSLKKLVSVDMAAITKAKYDIKSSDDEVKKGATIPMPVCSIEQYISLLGSEFQRKVLKENKSANGTLDVDLIASIDATGKARYSSVYVIDGIKFSNKIVVSEKLFDIEWLPATYKGEALASTFTVNFQADFSPDPTKRQRFIWNY
jgi:hypothetical protein